MSMEFQANSWRKSSRSGGNGAGQCVEVAITNAAVGVRDTKARELGHFTVDRQQWAAFTSRVKAGQFDI
ncbi:DUF397 domain-containing protein [Saccharopolyspora pogona]|uniref:DUF397 domain-containing protein n=1 Tax=Saccharopolyspora pogona TaxID=333966 RepID=UPI00295A9453|nr:DUF397 domain-containing protein [Saccharopolyspora pogona]